MLDRVRAGRKATARRGAPASVAQPCASERLAEALVDSGETQHFQKLIQFSIEHAADLVHWTSPAGQILFVNKATRVRSGYEREELLKMCIWDLDPSLSAASWPERWCALKAAGSVNHQSFHRTKTGELYPVELSINYVMQDGREYLFAFGRDIAERKAAEECLRESEERYRVLVDTTSDLIFSYDRTLHLTGVNSAAAHILAGSSVEAALGRHISELGLPEETWRRWEARCLEVLGSGKVVGQPSREVRLTNEATYILETDLWPIVSSEGEVVGVRGASRDITERAKAEEALRESEEQLRQAQKMEAIGQLAGGIAHDFNNILTVVMGYSELILVSEECSSGSLRSNVEEIKTAAERASALTRQILAFSRRQALKPEVLSLNDVLESTERLLRRTLGEDIELIALARPDLGLAEVDGHQLEQVLMNLALNARDAMPAGGTLTLETSNVELDREYCRAHPGIEPGAYVMLVVSDTGTGMDEETQSRAFEPFFTTKEPGKGTGLGLATVYGIVKQSGGSIFVYSEPGKGSMFKIYLPRVDKPARSRSRAAPPPDSVAGSETILVVEDETAVRELLSRVLGRLGYVVLSVGSGDDALALLREADSQVDLLLTDIVLPGRLQGNELACAASSLWPRLPVLYMSGYTRDAIVHSGRLDEGVNYIAKPFVPGELARKIREVLDARTPSG